MDSNSKIFEQDDDFWSNYAKGRPRVPDSFFDRIFAFHGQTRAPFGTVHDVGAGSGPFAQLLRSRFERVIVSDVVLSNVQLARTRLAGQPGFSFRVAKIDEVDDLKPGSVDMVFATNVMHFSDPQETGMEAIARQLAHGGTFAAALFGPARFGDDKIQDLTSHRLTPGSSLQGRNVCTSTCPGVAFRAYCPPRRFIATPSRASPG